MLVKNAERSLRYHGKRKLPKHNNCEEQMCHNALCIDILMIYGIPNLHNHMYFFRYLDVVVFHFH